jgi:hypothetical protein
LFEAPPGRFDDSLPRRLLVVLAVAHSAPLLGTALNRCRQRVSLITVLRSYYHIMLVMQRRAKE